MPRLRAALAVILLASVLVGAGGASDGASRVPGLRLVKGPNTVDLIRWDGEPIYIDLGVWVASVGGAVDLRLKRDAEGTITIRQVSTDRKGKVRTVRTIPSELADFEGGFVDFFDVEVRSTDGEHVASGGAPFCPNAWESARMNDRGPMLNRYPQYCWTSQLTRGMVWGIEDRWAVPAISGYGGVIDVPDGTYDITLRVAEPFASLFAVPSRDRQATVRATVTTYEWEEPEWPDEEGPVEISSREGRAGPVVHGDHSHSREAPEVQRGANGMPDLIALPAFNPTTRYDEETQTDQLEFSANVWNGGTGPLVVEGFRRPGQDVMTAYQYLYSKGQISRRMRAGTMEFDERDGHGHWHFTDFARYRLLSADRSEAVRSHKEAFCLAATDAIDLTIPGANWAPGSTGLHSACGWRNSIWIREILDAGWGDTYTQSVAGQAFDITDVPNGTYIIEVATNPDGRLRETSRRNNVAYREIVLGGTPGERTVEVTDGRVP